MSLLSHDEQEKQSPTILVATMTFLAGCLCGYIANKYANGVFVSTEKPGICFTLSKIQEGSQLCVGMEYEAGK